MQFKPFKPPTLLKHRNTLNADQPPLKKRRISSEDVPQEPAVNGYEPPALTSTPKPTKTFRAPLVTVKEPASQPIAGSQNDTGGVEGYYNVLWRKFTTKKNKTWDGDGILSVCGGYATLQDISGREMGRTACKSPLLPGSTLSVAGKDIEIDSVITREEFTAGRPFLGNSSSKPIVIEQTSEAKPSMKARVKQEKLEATQSVPRPTPSLPKATKAAFKNPMLHNTVQQKVDSKVPVPRHDPLVEGALIMKRPKTVPKGKQLVDVVVDPILSKHLREHQRAGVSFLYECVMGMRGYDGEGAILADEMGLGKTLQTIALIWTLLKQNPVYEEAPVIKKALIVCPVTLIDNWRKEFRKWLGNERIGVLVAKDNKTRFTDFTMGKAYNVMIIGYEKLRNVQQDLQKGAGIDIVIADEGHRLKTAQNKSAMAIKSLNTERRIILSGTPIQNDLSEFYTMVDFVNPGLLSKYSTFKREFETPILKMRQPEATDKDREKGEARSEELHAITGRFILRRTADILSKYLPPKTEYVLFCRPTKAQADVYHAILGNPIFNAALNNAETSLQLINVLKKVCNSPSLLHKKAKDDSSISTTSSLVSDLASVIPKTPSASSKLQVLDTLLHNIRSTTSEKVVLVSNYTSTLDILSNLLSALDYKYLRLDGQTPAAKRQDLVDRFNRTPASACFVFLLSAKAGGTGLNLIGASRLVLFDIDWNPATDLQAMGRIHRDGQKRPCYIYRLLTKGALDEKIFQRQVTKQGLADSVVDNKAGAASFSRDELRDLFSLDERRECQTHELLGCACGGTRTAEVVVDDDEDGDARRDCGVQADKPIFVEEDEEEDDLPETPFLKASQYDWRAAEKAIEDEKARKRAEASEGKGKMLSLMQYSHIDAALLRAEKAAQKQSGQADEGAVDASVLEMAVEDEALRAALLEDESRLDFIFAKNSS
ncbi:helicase [Zalaria obscura]|uniref:Helicase n=1 Tax=Zalaria obscura TaxID=2024903 RepID=A0ACC3SF05_9PEZI